MSLVRIDIANGSPAPKRGDLVQTNVGKRRERTWFVLHSRNVRRNFWRLSNRYELRIERWWELESETRLALFRSAERRGGQQVIEFKRYPVKRRKKTFEQYLGGE